MSELKKYLEDKIELLKGLRDTTKSLFVHNSYQRFIEMLEKDLNEIQ